ncbi:MAG: FAD-dependent oxidoreductase, partial [Actinomycetota bacterium]
GTGTGPAVNVALMSEVAPEYAPDGQALIAAACPGQVGGGDLATQVRAQLRRWWGAPVDGWRVLRVDRIAHGQPDSRPPFHPKQSISVGEGLFVCGDHRDTPSIQGALFSGRRCGEAAVAG